DLAGAEARVVEIEVAALLDEVEVRAEGVEAEGEVVQHRPRREQVLQREAPADLVLFELEAATHVRHELVVVPAPGGLDARRLAEVPDEPLPGEPAHLLAVALPHLAGEAGLVVPAPAEPRHELDVRTGGEAQLAVQVARHALRLLA